MKMNKEKVFAWIESLEDMADQSDRYFVERTELYKENQEKDREIENLKKDLINLLRIIDKNCDDLEGTEEEFDSLDRAEDLLKELKEGKE